MAAEEIIRGESLVVTRRLLQVDGVTPLPIATLTYLIARLLSATGESFQSYTFPSAAFRSGATPEEFVLEIVSEVTKRLPVGPIKLQIETKTPNAAFVVGGGQADIYREDLLVVSQ